MKRILFALILLVPVMATAQQPAPAPAPASSPAPVSDVPNLRFEVTITDEGGGAPALKKVVSVITRGNNTNASVRTIGPLPPTHPVALALEARKASTNVFLYVDARGSYEPAARRVSGRVAVSYQAFWPEAKSLPSNVQTQVDAVFDEGKPMLLVQAADPITDRRTTIQVTVTALR